MNLHPATLAALRSGPAGEPKMDEGMAMQYQRWQCAVCETTHKRERDAEHCCPTSPKEVFVSPDGDTFDSAQELLESFGVDDARCCPVCGDASPDAWQAADCCLWKDIEAPTRWRIAAEVEAGTPWVDAITTEVQAAQQ